MVRNYDNGNAETCREYHKYQTDTHLDTKIDPFTKVLASLTPLDIHPTRINNPNRHITVVANALVLLGNGKLRFVTHNTISIVPSGGEVHKLAECRELNVGCIIDLAPGWQWWCHLHAWDRSSLGRFDGLLLRYLALRFGDTLTGCRWR